MECGCLGARVPTSSSLHEAIWAVQSETGGDLGAAQLSHPRRRGSRLHAALILIVSRSGLNLGASVRSAAGGAYSGLCTQGQGETSVYCTARLSKKEGGQTLDGAHLRLARPTFPLGLLSKFRLAGCARLFRGPGLSTAYFPT